MPVLITDEDALAKIAAVEVAHIAGISELDENQRAAAAEQLRQDILQGRANGNSSGRIKEIVEGLKPGGPDDNLTNAEYRARYPNADSKGSIYGDGGWNRYLVSDTAIGREIHFLEGFKRRPETLEAARQLGFTIDNVGRQL